MSEHVFETAEMVCTGCPGVRRKIRLPSGAMKSKSILLNKSNFDSDFPKYKSFFSMILPFAIVDFNSTTHRECENGKRAMIHTDTIPEINIPHWPACRLTDSSSIARMIPGSFRHAVPVPGDKMGSCAMLFFDTWQDYSDDTDVLDGYHLLCLPEDAGKDKDSYLVCARGGIITFETSGQDTVDDLIEQMLANLKMDTTLRLSDAQKATLLDIARRLLDSGMEPAFVAGMVANFIKECGTAGFFESSNYQTNPEKKPDYLIIMDEEYDYREKYSGQYVFDKNLSELEELAKQLEAAKWKKGKFGLGCAQWTGERTSGVLAAYREEVGTGDSITPEQAIHAEGTYILEEFDENTGAYRGIYTDWKSNYSDNTDSVEAARNAGKEVCLQYERPKNRESYKERENIAESVYKVMMGTD